MSDGADGGTAAGAPSPFVPGPGPEHVTTTPTSTPTPTPTATATPTPAGSATPASSGPQLFYQGGYSQDPRSHDFNLDPNCGGEPELWAGLLQLDPDLQPLPDWAVSWEVNHDATQWIFHLRQDNHGWSNGDPVTAEDFVWSWQRQLGVAKSFARGSLLELIKNGSRIASGKLAASKLGASATDRWTLQVQTEGPVAWFLQIVASISTVPAHRASVEHWGADWTEAGRCVSNGPFRLTSWDQGSQFTIVRNEHYWASGQITLTDCVTPIISPGQGLIPYFTDQVDDTPVAGSDLTAIRQDDTLDRQLHSQIDTATWMLLPQVSIPPFNDLRVRRAISHAIDRDRIVQVMEGRAAIATSLLPTGFPAHINDPAVSVIQTFDVDAAYAALKGTPYSNGGGWPALTLTMMESDPDATTIAQDVIAQLGENLGMKLKLSALQPAAFATAVQQRKLGLIWYRNWFADPSPDDAYGPLFAASSDARVVDWRSSEFDAVLQQAKSQTDPGQRQALFRQTETLLQQAVAYIPVVYPVSYYLFQPWVQDLPTSQAGNLVTNNGLFSRLKSRIAIQGRQTFG